ncbi:histo-blood group ABO system transferase-like [Hyperolius riggenbachi]|uniref:histo-blood group ABO system transferase-like n=1 Tax=Hyperolius riggenbachi TaxID=752182 RepID=UPI0035A28F0F
MLDNTQAAIKKMMLPKQCVIGTLVVLMLFLVGLWSSNTLTHLTTWKINGKSITSILTQKAEGLQQISEKSIEVAHCERKLLLEDSSLRKVGLNALTPWLAPIVWDGIYDLDVLNNQHKDTRIGLFVFAVKKYIQFLQPFLESAEHYFMVGHNVTYYVFTDQVEEVKNFNLKLGEGHYLQPHNVAADKHWQDVSMRRMEILTMMTKEQMPKEIDYLICADVDMVFADHFGVETLGDLVATLHPGYFVSSPEVFPYERRPISTASIPHGQGDFYYMAALYGGKVEEIYKLSMACHKGIMEDKAKNIEAAWQEESHLNRYLVYNKPTKVLSPEYLWDTDMYHGEFIKRRRFLSVHKDHGAVRN